MSIKAPHTLLTGCTVGWKGTGGKMFQGEVTSYRKEGKLLQIRMDDDDHLWVFADLLEETRKEAFFIIKHGPRSIEYGLQLADMILQGKGTTLPVNTQMTTLAATVVALHDQLNALAGASQDAPAEAKGAGE